jgi:DNA phosphorothioation-dependent restriction protein DptH
MTAIVPHSADDLHAFVAERFLPGLKKLLEHSGPRQRLRVTAVPTPVMERLAAGLQGDGRWEVRVLTDGIGIPAQPWRASATKLIELRNALERPLLVFIPQGLRTAAEDSLDVATFGEVNLGTLGGDLRSALLNRIPEPLRNRLDEELAYLRQQRVIRSADDELAYLLTVEKNKSTVDAAGGALFVLGLIPDFDAFGKEDVRFRLSRNVAEREKLAETTQPLQSRIAELALAPGTLQRELFLFLRDRRGIDAMDWWRDVACDPACRHLAMDRWPFAEQGAVGELRLIMEPLGLPTQTEDSVGGALPVKVLKAGQALRAAFKSIPRPQEHSGWATYRFQVLAMDSDGARVAWESNSFRKPAGANRIIRRALKPQGLEEGTYYLRVEGYSEDGAVLTKSRAAEGEALPQGARQRAENESETFLFVDEDVDIEPAEPRATLVGSLREAWVELGKRALGGKKKERLPPVVGITGAWRETLGIAARGDVHFELHGEGSDGFTVVVPGILRRLECAILDASDRLGVVRLNLKGARRPWDVEPEPLVQANILGDQAEAKDFLISRAKVFAAIRQQHVTRGKLDDESAELTTEQIAAIRPGIVETTDLMAIGGEIADYARSWTALVQALLAQEPGPAWAEQIGALARLDTVEVRWQAGPRDPGRALLASPTHPVRLLWHLQHTATCDSALDRWALGRSQVPSWRDFIDQLSDGLLPFNLPLVLFGARERAYVEHGPLTDHWSLYLPDRTDGAGVVDNASCRDRVQGLLGIRERSVAPVLVDADEVASRMFEYLAQHPYVEQLTLNVFNPGDGRLVADVLRAVEAHRRALVSAREPPALRYAVRLFSSGERLDEIGSEIEALIDPERQVEEDDEFTLAASNHLLPKLVFARNTIAEFLQEPARFSAHVTVLLEQFAVRGRVASIEGLRRGSFVGGLVQEPETTFESRRPVSGWTKGLRPEASPNPDAREGLLQLTLSAVHRLQASAAQARGAAADSAPVVSLELTTEAQALIKHAHDVSDWVLTIDRNLGLEFFDSPSSIEEAGYLLDFAPEYLQEDRQRILLTTRSSIELQSLVAPMLGHFNLPVQPGDEGVVLEAVRSLSGRLALRFGAAATQATEVVGLLLARWKMGETGQLSRCVVIPLDAHRGWFRAEDDDGEPVSERRADLLLVGFDPAKRAVRMRIVEVKARKGIPPGGRAALYAAMKAQTENTATRLRELFDPERFDGYPERRADFLVRAKELSTALAFYVRRGARYGLLLQDEANAALDFVQSLDAGYRLELSAFGVVFEVEGQGTRFEETEPGFTVCRFGLDEAKRLLARALGRDVAASEDSSRTGGPQGGAGPGPQGGTKPGGSQGGAGPGWQSGAAPGGGKGAVAQALSGIDTLRELMGFGSAAALTGVKTPAAAPQAPSVAAAPESQRIEQQVGPIEETTPRAPIEPAVPTSALEQDSSSNAERDVAQCGSAGPASEQVPEIRTESVPDVDQLSPIQPDVLVGATQFTPQMGLLGRAGTQTVALDLNGCNTISLFGVQGFGKSYTLGVVAEMASAHVSGINVLPSPLATVIFHYHKSDAYAPEYAAARAPNEKRSEVERLLQEYGARPTGLRDVVLLAPEAKVDARRQEFPGLNVLPLKFSSAELGAESWKFLLGAADNQALYMKQIVSIMRTLRGRLTVEGFRRGMEQSDLGPGARRLAEERLLLAEPYIDDRSSLGALLRPGRTVIVDLRDEWIEKEEALGLFVVMLRIFAAARHQGREFNKLVVFDEAHKYITESDLIGQVVETIREMRHQATSVVIASQDPLSVPRAIIELTSVLLLHRMTSPAWLKHLKSAILALDQVQDSLVASLAPGEALIWAQRATDSRFTQRPQRIQIRPRFTQHGGGTKTAVAGATIR